MKTLVISKPIYEYILPLVEFPLDGDKFFIDKSIQSVSSTGTVIACTLGNYGMDVSYTGMIGEDDIGKKITNILNSYKVDTQYIETSYTEKTMAEYKIYNSKSNKFTSIVENSLKNNLTKYKYEFIPDVIIMDDKDYNANLAALNNYPKAKTIFIGDKYTNESSIYCNKCNYVICSLQFASNATGVVNNLNKDKNIVALFQKFIDLYSANLIIKLSNFDFLYVVNDEVRLIKNVNNNLTNKDDVYYSVLVFNLINGMDVESSIKLTNKIMISSGNEIDMLKNIPTSDVVRTEFENMQKLISSNQSNIQGNNQIQTSQGQNNQIQNIQVQNNPVQTSQIKNVQTQNAQVQNNQIQTSQNQNVQNTTQNNNMIQNGATNVNNQNNNVVPTNKG